MHGCGEGTTGLCLLLERLICYATLHYVTPHSSTPQHQLERRDLKRAQLNLDALCGPAAGIQTEHVRRQILLLVLERIRLDHFLDFDLAPAEHAFALAAQRVVHAHNDRVALFDWQLAARDVLVVFAALDGVEDEVVGAEDLERREHAGFRRGCGLACEIGRGGGLVADDAQGVVELEGFAHRGVGERARVREDGVFGRVAAHVCVGVGRLGRAENAQTHHVARDGEAVLGVVEDGNAVGGFGEVGPFVHADLELGHVPACVVVGWATHDTVLRFVAGFGVGDVDGELDLEELHGLVPFDIGFDLDGAGCVADCGGKRERCGDPRLVRNLGLDCEGHLGGGRG